MGASGPVFGSHCERWACKRRTRVGSLRVNHRFFKSRRLLRTPQRFTEAVNDFIRRLYHSRGEYASRSLIRKSEIRSRKSETRGLLISILYNVPADENPTPFVDIGVVMSVAVTF